MADYWIRDSQGRTLGPVSLQVLADLAGAGHLHEMTEASTDGQSWSAVAQFAELGHLFGAKGVDPQVTADRREAQRIQSELAQMKQLSATAIFGVPEGVGLDEFKLAALALVKEYHPARLRHGADPALASAAREMFQFLGERMRSAEKQLVPAQERARAAPRTPAPTQALESELEARAPRKDVPSIPITREGDSFVVRLERGKNVQVFHCGTEEQAKNLIATLTGTGKRKP